jgi:hypothetical protein
LVLVILYSFGFVEGVLSEQVSLWAANNNLGLGLFILLSVLLASAVVVFAIEELFSRARHGWRLPA